MKRLEKEDIKTLGLSSLGGTLEFYDFIIFAIFTPYFTHHFFPAELDESIKLINTYGTFAAGYLARPIGGFVMAHFGDKFGRKNMFLLSIVLMVVPTFIFAIMPTYEHIGYFAIAILLIIRLLQGIAIGGELPGAWVFVYEHSPNYSRSLFLGILTCGVCGGILLGTTAALVLQLNYTEQEIKDYAYRIPFLLGGIFGIISVYLRRFLSETPTFKKLKESNALSNFPLKAVVKEHKKDIVLSMMITWVLTACVLVMIILMPNFLKSLFTLKPIVFTCMQMGGAFMMMVGLVCTGALADNFERSSVCKFFAFWLFIFCGLSFYEMYIGKDPVLFCLFYLVACFFSGIVNFASVFMCNLYKPNILFSGVSFGYNCAYAIAGFITPILIFALHDKAVKVGGIYTLGAGVYMCFIAVVAFVSAIIFDKLKRE